VGTLAELDVEPAALAGPGVVPHCACSMGERERSDSGTQDTLAKRNLAEVGDRLTREGKAVDFLLKGPEYKLGDGTLFVDKQGFARKSVRAKWWIPIRPGMTHAEAAMPAGEICGEGAVPDGVSIPGYSEEAPAIFFGHYWFAPEEIKALWPQTSRA
jgi:hypothetical protein